MRYLGEVVLLFVTFCWGVSFPLIENSVATLDPSVFVMVRFFLAALVLLPFVFSELKNSSRRVIIAGMILGILNAVTYICQTIGLQTVSAGEAAFITGISVVMVPFILPLFALGKPGKRDVLSSLLCLLGLFFLVGVDLAHINTGAAWVLLCAVSVAVTIVYLQKASSNSRSLALLAFYQILFTAIFSIPFSIGKNFHPLLSFSMTGNILFCAIFATSLALFLQTKYQHFTTANRAAMIFCFEPIFGALAGYFINGERIAWPMLAGGICILLGLAISLININTNKEIVFES